MFHLWLYEEISEIKQKQIQNVLTLINILYVVRLKCQYIDRLIAVLKQVELESGEFSIKKFYEYTRIYQDLISMIQCMCKGHLFL